MAFGLSTIIAAHVAFSISYVVFIVRARIATLDATLEEAAMDLGRNADGKHSTGSRSL